MSLLQPSELQTPASFLQRQGLVLAVFAVTLFMSALLLFGLQPLFAKMVLPKLGGSPAVWSVALVFFQGVLLIGYTYAHALTHWFKPRTAVLIHLITLTLAALSLPVAYPLGWAEPPNSGLLFWVFGLFAIGVGVPFFAVSANAPLLQSWFSKTGHPHSADPYFLYGASNIGSFCALFLYPFLLEPTMALGTQSMLWSMGYVVLAALIVMCCCILWKVVKSTPEQVGTASRSENANDISSTGVATSTAPASKVLTWGDRGVWIGLSLVPSGLLVAVTQHITTDLVSAPFLWILPLALFLLTFVITFQRNPILPHSKVLWMHSFLVAPLIMIMFGGSLGLHMVPIHLGVFFLSAMVCHGELVRRRPAAEHLTEFYLWMSFGGLIGGLLVSLVAPHVFNQVLEYPILILAVFLCRRETLADMRSGDFKAWLPLLAAAVLLAAQFNPVTKDLGVMALYPFLAIAIAGIVLLRHRTFVQTGMVAFGMVVILGFTLHHDVVTRVRSFFGVAAVLADNSGQYHLLKHGSTLHGAEKRRDADGTIREGKPDPLTYYYMGGPLQVAVDKIRQNRNGLNNVAVIGLGVGTMACHREEGETWRFFEIDQEIVNLARDPRYFRFLSSCGESGGIVVGDGRITLGKEPDKTFDVIVLDAFSSDSIPVHLLTKEALELYFDKLTPGGALVFHISNRYMELASIVSAMAKQQDAFAYFNVVTDEWHADPEAHKVMPLVAVVAKSKADLGAIASSDRWISLPESKHSTPWSDDFSNILGAMVRAKTVGVAPQRSDGQ